MKDGYQVMQLSLVVVIMFVDAIVQTIVLAEKTEYVCVVGASVIVANVILVAKTVSVTKMENVPAKRVENALAKNR